MKNVNTNLPANSIKDPLTGDPESPRHCTATFQTDASTENHPTRANSVRAVTVSNRLHRWDLSPREAIALQAELAPLIQQTDGLPGGMRGVRTVGGIDIAFADGGETTRSSAVLLSWPGMDMLDEATITEPTRFPYVPGLLSFREVPAALAALDALGHRPDVLLCDGQGIAHPRRFGIACHLGLLAGLPTIGVAKSRLVGAHVEPGTQKGARAALFDKNPETGRRERIGTVLRTRDGVKPVYVSIGHRVSLSTATRVVLKCATRFRLPEPTRLADKLSKRR